MIKTLRVAVDHGNRNMKTSHVIFTSGLNILDKKPARGEQYLQYSGSKGICTGFCGYDDYGTGNYQCSESSRY